MRSKIVALVSTEAIWLCTLNILLGAVFVIAGATKLLDVKSFADDIEHYKIMPREWQIYTAAILPWIEVTIGIMSFVKSFRLAASLMIFLLMNIFVLLIIVSISRGLDVSCGCFGKTFREYAGSGVSFLYRDLILLIFSGTFLMLSARANK